MASIIRTDALQNLNTSNVISQTNSTTITIGSTGQTIAVASGATLLGGGITWTSTVVTSAMTVAVNTGYFVNTSSNAITVTLPASAAVGNTIILSDFNRTWATNNLTLSTNALNFQGNTSPSPVYSTDGQTVQLVYSGATKGWIPISDDDVTLETPQSYSADFLVIAGGGAGGAGYYGGGGGAGGYRYFTSQQLTKLATYTITVGAGGAGGVAVGASGGTSSISGTGISYTSAGGGGGGNGPNAGTAGGSGGGSTGNLLGGAGNTPSVSPSQGFAGGGLTGGNYNGAGGGGASAVGGNPPNGEPHGAPGGNGTANSITGSSVTYAGGGGGGSISQSRAGGTGGGGNGGNYSPASAGTDGTVNTGGGGGGGGDAPPGVGNGRSGGTGIVILRVLTSDYTGTTTGSPTVTTDGSYKVLKYTGSGSYTA